MVPSVLSVPLDQASVMRRSDSFNTHGDSQSNGVWTFIE